VSEMCAVGGLHEDRKSPSPFFHPVHGYAAEKGRLGAFVKCGGFWMVGDEALRFALVKLPKFRAIDRAHRSSRMISRAALAPLAPVRPLPGCVPEPQRKRPRTGVL